MKGDRKGGIRKDSASHVWKGENGWISNQDLPNEGTGFLIGIS